MAARRVPALALPVDPQAAVSFRGYQNRTPLLTITTGRPALLVTLTLPDAPVPPALWGSPATWTGDRHHQALAPVPERQEVTA